MDFYICLVGDMIKNVSGSTICSVLNLPKGFDQKIVAYTEDILCIQRNGAIFVYDIDTYVLLGSVNCDCRRIFGYGSDIFIVTDTGLHSLGNDFNSYKPIMNAMNLTGATDIDVRLSKVHAVVGITFENKYIVWTIPADITKKIGSIIYNDDLRRVLVGTNRYSNLCFRDDNVSNTANGAGHCHHQSKVFGVALNKYGYPYTLRNNELDRLLGYFSRSLFLSKKILIGVPDSCSRKICVVDIDTGAVTDSIVHDSVINDLHENYVTGDRFFVYLSDSIVMYDINSDDGKIIGIEHAYGMNMSLYMIPCNKVHRRAFNGFQDIDIIIASDV